MKSTFKMGRYALLRRGIGRLNLILGRFDCLKRIDTKGIKRLVFVCRGNVCRSPYAEAAAKSLGFSATSCGVDVRHSAPAEEMAVSAALLCGKDLSKHMSRSIFKIAVERTDCLIAMDRSHLPIAREVAARSGCQITLIGLWKSSPVPDIADPYGRPLQTFSLCFDEIDDSLSGLVNCLTSIKRH